MVAKVIGEPESLSRLKIYPETGSSSIAANSIAVVCLYTNPEVVVVWSVFASKSVVVHLNERNKNTDP